MRYTNSNWDGSGTDRRSTIGGCFYLGSSMISRMSRKQDIVALSSVKVQYVVPSEECQEFVRPQKLVSNLFEGSISATQIHCDNESCIKLTEDLEFHAKKKYINNKYHYIRSLVLDGVVDLYYIPTNE